MRGSCLSRLRGYPKSRQTKIVRSTIPTARTTATFVILSSPTREMSVTPPMNGSKLFSLQITKKVVILSGVWPGRWAKRSRRTRVSARTPTKSGPPPLRGNLFIRSKAKDPLLLLPLPLLLPLLLLFSLLFPQEICFSATKSQGQRPAPSQPGVKPQESLRPE